MVSDVVQKTVTRGVTRQRDAFILMYHHVGSVVRLAGLSPFVVSPDAFRMQLDAIQRCGRVVTTLTDLLRESDSENPLPPRIVITFDDCPAELADVAIPELERRGLRATFFVVAGKVGGYNDWDVKHGLPRVPLMNWRHLRELANLGHEIGSHGFTHRNLRSCLYSQAGAELSDAKATLQDRLGIPITTVAYPFGEAPDAYATLCREAGYVGGCSIFSMSRSVLGDRFMIRRILVSERDVAWRMRIKLSRAYLRARALLVDGRVLRASGILPVPDATGSATRRKDGLIPSGGPE